MPPKQSPTTALPTSPAPAYRSLRLAAAGALAGMFTNTLLHPLDTVKTLRQTNPGSYRGVFPSISTIVRTRGAIALYAGIAPALLGSALSSALYFGVYELIKSNLHTIAPSAFSAPRTRAPLTALSAACGNIASSVLFVPKEVVKQRMQAGLHHGTFFSAAAAVIRTSGPGALYRGYKATLLRNIPSTMIRFALYEEFKLIASRANPRSKLSPPEYITAGALAGAFSSACTTPMDVVKTRFATGRIKPGTSVFSALVDVLRTDGVPGLFAGIQPRVVWSALFAAVGFSTYELCKAWMLGVRSAAFTKRLARRRTEQKVSFGLINGRRRIASGFSSDAVCARRLGRSESARYVLG